MRGLADLAPLAVVFLLPDQIIIDTPDPLGVSRSSSPANPAFGLIVRLAIEAAIPQPMVLGVRC